MMSRVILLSLVFITALAAFLVIRLPLGVAMDVLGLDIKALRAQGSVWDGVLVDAGINGVALGDVDIALSPLSLLRGEGRTMLRLQANALRGDATAFKTLGGEWGIDDTSLTLELGPWFGAQGISGLAHLTIAEMRLGSKACMARGDIAITGVHYASQPLPPLNGPILCENGRIIANLSSADEATVLQISLAYQAGGLGKLNFDYKGE